MKKIYKFGASLFAAFVAAAWLAMILADLGWFRAWACAAAAAVVATAAFFLQRSTRTDGTEDESPACFVMALVMALGFLVLVLPASEMILGGWDPGVYLHTAASVAKHGSLRIADPDMAVLTDQEKHVVARNLFGVAEPFGGMRVLPNGWTSPEFHHLFPSVLAIVYAFGGIRAALCVNPVLCASAIVLLYLLAARWVGRGCAVFAALLLALNPAEIWQARFPTAEPLAQVLLLGGFLLLPRVLSGGTVWDAVVAGAALGLALLARYDTVLLLVPLAAVLAVSWEPGMSRRNMAVALGTFGLILVHLHYHQKYVAPYYTPVSDLVQSGIQAAVVLLAVWLVAVNIPRLGLAAQLRRHGTSLSLLIAAVFALWVAFAWYVRPELGEPCGMTSAVKELLALAGKKDWMNALAGEDASNMMMLTSLFGRLGLGLAFGGVIAMILREKKAWQAAWLYPSIFVLVIMVSRVFNDHFMMWVSRRFIPVVLPLLCVSSAFGVKDLFARLSSRNVFAAIGCCVGLFVAVPLSNIPSVRTVAAVRDWPGLLAWFDQVGPVVPGDAIVYCDQPGFAAPLRYLYDKHAFELQLKADDRRKKLAELMMTKIVSGKNVWLLTTDGPIDFEGLYFEPVGAFPLQSYILDTRRLTIPNNTKPRGGDFMLYHVRPRS